MILQEFRRFVADVGSPKLYTPVYTESRGALNLVFGVAYLVAGLGMKLSRDPLYQNQYSKRHLALGWRTLDLGFYQFVPGVVAAMGISLAVRQISKISFTYSSSVSFVV